MIRICAIIAALVCFGLALFNFKRAPLDWHYWGGLCVAGLACVLVAANPELLYIGMIGVGLAALANFWPSIAAAKFRSAGDEFQEFVDADPDRTAAWVKWKRKHGEDKDKATFKALRRDAV
jgi:hypothetical protein